jgi:predicted RNase H-like nuclease (RuvC/YqgF family)
MVTAQNTEMQEQFGVPQLYNWLKSVEGKVNRLTKEMETLKLNFSHKVGELTKEIKMVNDELVELKREREHLHEKMGLIIKELKVTAGKEEVLTLKKYIDLWNPMHFATQKDVERLIEEKIQ